MNANHFSPKTRLSNILGILLISVVIIIYFAYVFHIAVNIPFWDEYLVLGNWLDLFTKQTFHKNLIHLFGQANEHRIFSYKLTVLLQYLIFGDINFRYIIIFGNIGMFWLLYQLYKLSPIFKTNILAFFPIILLLFVPQHEITNWGIVALGSIFQYSLVFASLALLNKQGYLNFSLAVLFAIIATFSFGNGMFTFFAGFIILFFSKQKQATRITFWATFMIASILLYFHGYNFSTGEPSKFEIFHQPINAILFFLTLFGSLFAPLLKGNLILLYISGFIVIASFFFLAILKWDIIKKFPLLLSLIAFLLITAAAATISRVGYGVGAATAPRYMLLPVLFVVIFYILVLYSYNIPNAKVMVLVLVSSMILYVTRMTQQHEILIQHKSNLIEGIASYYNDPTKTSLGFYDQQIASNYLTTSINKKYYYPPAISELSQKRSRIENINIPPATNDIAFCIDSIGANSTTIHVRGWAFLKEKNWRDQCIGITLNSLSDTLLFETTMVSRPDVVKYFKKENSVVNEKCGYNFIINWRLYQIPSDQYQVGLFIMKDGKIKSYINTNQVLNLKTD